MVPFSDDVGSEKECTNQQPEHDDRPVPFLQSLDQRYPEKYQKDGDIRTICQRMHGIPPNVTVLAPTSGANRSFDSFKLSVACFEPAITHHRVIQSPGCFDVDDGISFSGIGTDSLLSAARIVVNCGTCPEPAPTLALVTAVERAPEAASCEEEGAGEGDWLDCCDRDCRSLPAPLSA